MTEVLRVDPEAPDPAAIARAAKCVRDGGLVAFPTETVYGLGVHALDAAAVVRLFAAKGRPAHDPLIVHVESFAHSHLLLRSVPDAAHALAARFWPGPLTLVLPRSERVPNEVTAGLDTVAVRVPAHAVAQAILRQAAVPIAAPSANLFSRPSPTRASHVLEDLGGRIDIIVDAGPTFFGVESTVVDLTRDVPLVLRPGAVTIAALREVLPLVRAGAALHDREDGPARSPGLLARHYSPRAPLTLYEGASDAVAERIAGDARAAVEAGRVVGVLAAEEDRALPDERGVHRVVIGSERDLDQVAAKLYDGLRRLDEAGVDLILARGFADQGGIGEAIQDRLRRAAAGRIVSLHSPSDSSAD